MRTERIRLAAAGTVLVAVAVTAADAVTATVPVHRPPPASPAAPPRQPAAPPAEAPAPGAAGQPGRDVPVDPPGGQVGVPDVALRAYRTAEQRTAQSRPSCHLSWSLVAAIGRVESNHARGGQVDTGGTTLSPILGPQLSGNGYATIADTDNGALDGDIVWHRPRLTSTSRKTRPARNACSNSPTVVSSRKNCWASGPRSGAGSACCGSAHSR